MKEVLNRTEGNSGRGVSLNYIEAGERGKKSEVRSQNAEVEPRESKEEVRSKKSE
jgi:hypothetical protein